VNREDSHIEQPERLVEQEFLAAYDKYAEPIYRHCFFRVYSEAKAEELVQDTFMKTWDYLRQGKQVHNLRPFLYRVANNLIIDYSRKRKEDSLERVMEDNPSAEPVEDDKQSPEHRLLLQQVRDSLKRLPEEAREILIMRYIDDLDPKDIAQVLNITPNHVSVKINRALKLLQQLHD
jgi:RNA polymerase sigma-70 factor, ECF subfamily